MTSPLAIQIHKEVRELLPWWLGVGGLGIIGLRADVWVAAVNPAGAFLFGLVAFASGSVALGANVFGHEYTNKTMPALLALPVRRARLLAVKLGVLLALVAALTLGMFWGTRGFFFAEHLWRESFLVIGGLAVGVAPCLTLIFRSPLAGAAFAAATPVIFWMAGLWIPDWSPSDVEEFTRQGCLFVSGAGLAMTCVLFQRLEAIEGPVSDRGVPGWFKRTAVHREAASAAPPRTHHPILALVWKELRLQRMTMLISVFFAVAWLVTAFARFADPQTAHLGVLFPLTGIHGVLVTVMAGALAFAEERQLGAWSMQTLLPIRGARQTDVKVIVALSLALLLAIAVPVVLNVVAPVPEALAFDAEQMLGVLMICAAALFVSSASASGIRAVLTMLPFTVLVLLTAGMTAVVSRGAAELAQAWTSVMPKMGWSWRTWRDVIDAVGVALFIGQAAFMLTFAYWNHRTADRSHRRYAIQVGWLILYALAAAAVFGFAGTMGEVFVTTRVK